MTPFSDFLKIAAGTAVVLFIAACGGAGRDEKAGQVMASVDGAEITIHQLNAELGRLNIPPASADAADRMTADVLRKLVDQQLLVAQAKAKNLDRAPHVVQAIELAKRQILAEAYIRQLAGSPQPPTEQELMEYYIKHPELFQNRKLYTLRTVAVSKQGLNPAAIETMQKNNSLAEVEAYLKTQNISYQKNTVVHPAEDIPMAMLPKMANARAGQLFLLEGAAQITLYTVVTANDQPITLDQAKPVITRYLHSQSNEQRVRAELSRLRNTARIVYQGKFVARNPTDESIAIPASSVSQEDTNVEGVASQSMQRGLSGLK